MWERRLAAMGVRLGDRGWKPLPRELPGGWDIESPRGFACHMDPAQVRLCGRPVPWAMVLDAPGLKVVERARLPHLTSASRRWEVAVGGRGCGEFSEGGGNPCLVPNVCRRRKCGIC